MSNRLVVAQGPLQLLQAMAVLEQMSSTDPSTGRDVLLLGGMGVEGSEKDALHRVCRRIATLWPFQRIEEIGPDRIGCTSDEWAVETASLANRFRTSSPDQILVCRNYQFVNEVAMGAFEGAERIAYGDSLGIADVRPAGSPSSNRPEGAYGMHANFSVFPSIWEPDAWEANPPRIVELTRVGDVLRRAAAMFPELGSVAKTLEARGASTLVLTTYQTEACGMADPAAEISAISDAIIPETMYGECVVVKGHPRERFGQSERFADLLMAAGRSVVMLDEIRHIPVELLIQAWKPKKAFTLTSSSSIPIAWIAGCDVHVGFGRRALSRLFEGKRLADILVAEEILALQARKAMLGKAPPVARYDRGDHGQFHHRPIRVSKSQAELSEGAGFPQWGLLDPVTPSTASRVRRLHLGSGRKRMFGYLDVDAYVPSQGILPVSHVELPHRTSSVDEILSEHSLEHIGKYEVPLALAEWARVLRPGGRLLMNLPNLEWCMRAWLATPEEHRWGWQLDTIFGLQDHPGEYHKTGFTAPRLQQLLSEAGFKDIRIDDYWSHGQGCFWVEAVRDDAIREPAEGRARSGIGFMDLVRPGFGPVDPVSGKAMIGLVASFVVPAGHATEQLRIRFDLELPSEGLAIGQKFRIHVQDRVLEMNLDSGTPTGIVSLDIDSPKGDVRIEIHCDHPVALAGDVEIGGIVGRLRVLASRSIDQCPESVVSIEPELDSILSKALFLHLEGDPAAARRRMASGVGMAGVERLEKALLLLQMRCPEAALWELEGIEGSSSVDLLRAVAIAAAGDSPTAAGTLDRIDASTPMLAMSVSRALARLHAWQGDWNRSVEAMGGLEGSALSSNDRLYLAVCHLLSGRVAEASGQLGEMDPGALTEDGIRLWFETLLSQGRESDALAWLDVAIETHPENRFEWNVRRLAMAAGSRGGLQVEAVESGNGDKKILEEALRARSRGDLEEERRLLRVVRDGQTAGSVLSRILDAREAIDRMPTSRRAPLPAVPKASIVIPVYDGLELTRNCVDSILRTGAKHPFEIIVVDDASRDGTREYLRGLRDEGAIVLVEHAENSGFAASCNDGAKAATGDALVFLNNDTIAGPGWLDALVDELARDESVGAVGSFLLFPDGRVQHAGLVWKWSVDHPYPEHIFRFDPGNIPEARVVVDYPCVTGACLAVPKDLFEEMDRFSESFGMYCEDADFCLRVWDRGLRVRYAPTSKLVHLESSTPMDLERRLERSRIASEILYSSWAGRWPAAFDSMPAWMWPTQAKRGRDAKRAAAPVSVEPMEKRGPREIASPAILDVTSAIKGRIPIAMPAYNRDKYLVQVLSALRRCNDLDRFFIVTGEEPGCPGTASLFDSIDWIPVLRGRNKERLGCNGNVIGTIDRALELSDRMLSLEDDVVPAQDFLSFVLWGLERFRDDSSVFDVGGYQRHIEIPPIASGVLAKPFDWFSSWGWATWRDRWDAFRRDVKVESMGSVSWDCFVVDWAVKSHRLKEVRPLVSRIQNIGEEGTWVPSAQWQRENQHTPHWMGNLGWEPVSSRGFALEGERVAADPSAAEIGGDRTGAPLAADVGSRKLSGVLAAVASGLRTVGSGAAVKAASMSSSPAIAKPNSSARILLDLRTLADPNSISRGIGHYSLHLARAILARGGHRFGVLWDDRAGMERRPDLGNTSFEWVAYSTYQPGSWDLVHAFDPMGNHPDYEDPFTLFAAEPRLSITFYDLIPWHIYRETMGRYWEVYLTRLERMKASDATYMCISRYTGEDLVREIGVDAARTEVVMAGLNAHHESGRGELHDRALIGQYGIDGPFCLYVGALDQHKNFDGAVNAWNRARTSIPGLKLVVVGRKNGLVQGVEKQVMEKGLSGGIVFTGFVERDVLEALYRCSIATLFLSRFEGFGFPVLEAMAANCPVICSNATSIPEVAGDAAIVCGPDDHDAAAAALVRLHGNAELRRDMIARGGRQAASFTWDKVAAAVLARWKTELVRPPRVTNLRRIATSRIEMLSPLYDPSGYAAEARPVLKHLVDVDLPIKAIAIGRTSMSFREGCPAPMRKAISVATDRRSSDGLFVQVVWFPGYAFQRNPLAAWNVGRTMFETDSLPKDWIDPCNSMNEIWVPTDFNLETFREAGVTVPLLKVPGGVDTASFRPGLDPLPIPGKPAGTTFLSVFEWTARKGFDVLLKGWARAFKPSDDVRLVLRTYPPNQIEGDPSAWVEERISEVLASVGASRSSCAPIVVLAGQVPEVDMPRLYNAADVYLAPSRGEGWGRPHMESMSCGVPVIATRWSGNLEFQDDGNSWLIDVEKLVPVGEDMAFKFYQGQKWAEPSLESFVGLLGKAWKDVEERRAKGAKARRDMEEKWDWSISARFVSERLAEILQGIAPEHSHLADPNWRSGLLGTHVATDREHQANLPTARFAPAPSEPEGVPGTLAVRWEGSQFVHHSLAHVNRELCAGLAKKGHDLSIIPYEPDQFGPGLDSDLQILQQLTNAPLEGDCQIHLRHQWPPNLVAPKEGRWVVVQPWEFGSPPKEWMPAFRDQVDELWAYTGYVRDMYIRAGVPEDRVHIVPLGVDCDKFRPGLDPLPSLPPKRGLRFLYVGGSIARKGFDVLMNAWQKAFGPDDPVELLIKDMGGKTTYAGQTGERFVRQIQDSGRFAPIHYLNEDLAPADLPALYASGDVLVHPYRGEGFGLPIAEAMACGLPVIVSSGGAADDFCGSDEAWKIPTRRVPLPGGKVDQMETVEDPWWLEVSEEALVAALREAATNPQARACKGAAARRRIEGGFTWSHAVDAAERRLRAVAARPVRRFEQRRASIVGSPRGLASLSVYNENSASGVESDDVSESLLEIEMLISRGDFVEADRLSQIAVEAHPKQSMAWLARAMVLRGLRKTGRALEALNKALEAGGGAEVHYEMLALQLQANKEGAARAQWNILREQYPEWVVRQRAHLKEQGHPWLPDRLVVSSKSKNPKARKR